MSRYHPEMLQAWAKVALRARDEGDPRWQVLKLMLTARFMLSLQEVEARIERLALGATA